MGDAASYQHGQFCWNECGTTDQDAAKAFYGQLFGWTAEDSEMPGERGTYTRFQLDGKDMCGLYTLMGPLAGVPPHWIAYVNVESADATCEQAADKGGEILFPACDIPDVGRMAWLKDPQGAAFAVFEFGAFKGAGQVAPEPGGFCWNEVMTTDAEAATAFYTSVFPWSPAPMPMGDGSTYTMMMVAGAPAGGLMQMGPEFGELPPHWMGYVAVADCDATAEQAKALGGAVCHPPTDIPNIGRFAVLQDPQGAVFSVIKLAPQPT